MPQSRPPLAIDLFCGAGGLSLGFERAGFEIVAAIDSNPVNITTYSQNFPETKTICADIASISGSLIRAECGLGNESIDVIFGGPPCQGFSTIGKRNLADPRNTLIFEFCRLVSELNPKYFVIENVAGLMYGAARSILESALQSLLTNGYEWLTPIQILNAQNFGVPQRRRRVFVIGSLTSEKSPQYPKLQKHDVTVWDAISDLRHISRSRKLYSTDVYVGELGVANPYSSKLRGNKKSTELTGCLLCQHQKKVISRFRKTPPGKIERISRFARLKKTSVAPTLRAGTPSSHGSFTAARPIHPTQPRCITVREAARLHSFPDWFQFHGTQWHGFQQVGNSVPPKLAQAVAQAVKKVLGPKT